MDENTVTLFRPVGQKEMDHIKDTGYREFPPRLPSQPIFYPVSNREYAAQIAREWNTRDPRSGYVGYVTQFRIRAEFLDRYPIKTVGGSVHKEYWIPAAELTEFNQNIVDTIDVIDEFRP
jgi:hypothetical protein